MTASQAESAAAYGKIKFSLVGCFLAFILAAPLHDAGAAESPIPITPPGGTDTDQASLPPPGAYGGAVVVPFNQNTRSYDNKGRPVPDAANLRLDIRLYIPVFLYVYPFKVFGGSIGSTFIQPLQSDTYSIGNTLHRSALGLSDAYSDLFYWTRFVGLAGATQGRAPLAYGLSVAAGLALIIPDGDYSKRYPINLGSNSWVVDPNIAATYNTGPSFLGENTQVSVRAFYGIPFRNPATHYKTGHVFDADYSVTEDFGLVRAGLTGFYQTQLTDDNAPNGGRPIINGNKYSELSIGPIIQYFIPKYNAFVKAKYGYTFFQRNFTNQQFVTLSVGFKF